MLLRSLLPVLCAIAPILAAEPAQHTLRGFGPVATSSAEHGAVSEQVFACASPRQALVLMHKLGRDLALSATITPRWEEVAIGGARLRVLVREGLGAFLPVVVGAEVRVFTVASDPAAFAAIVARSAGGSGFDPAFTYPMYLDRFTVNGIGSWYPSFWDQGSDGKPLTQPNDVEDHLAFIEKHNLTIQPNSGGYLLRNLLPRLHELGLPFHFAQWHEWSQELAVLAPEELVQPGTQFTTMPHYYGQVSDGGRRLLAYRDWSFQQTMLGMKDDPQLIDWLDPNGEVGPFDFFSYWDFSEGNRLNLVRYLRDARGYTPESLGLAWHGAPYASWDAVRIPMDYSHLGWRQGDPLADQTWRVQPGSADAVVAVQEGLAKGWQGEAFDDTGWAGLDIPGGELGSIYWRVANSSFWHRGTISVDAGWLAQAKAAGRINLTVAAMDTSGGWRNPDRIWVNGQELAALSVQPGGAIIGQVGVTALLKPGRNSIVYLSGRQTDSGLAGPMFLSTRPLESYPFADQQLNARYRDWRDYQSWCVMEKMENTFKAIRAVDPDRPIKMQAAQDKQLGIPLQERFGCYGHNTGEGGFFRPWDKRFGQPYGVPASAEFGGGITSADGLRRWLGWYSFEGTNLFDNFHNVQEMMYSPARDVWTEYLPYLKLAPWRDLKQPDIAVLWSAHNNHLLARPVPYCFDLGRGDLQSIGYSYVYAHENTIRDRKLGGVSVLWDSGTWIMDPETVQGIRAWVEAGGTFVALQETGRHTFTQRDAWPISELTGFRVREFRPMTGTVSILNDQPLFRKLAGRNFYNRGRSIDYSDHNYADQCIALDPVAPGVVPVARYQDGAIAIGLRNLGKGRVIVLGSPFWRDSFDRTGMWWPGEGQCQFLEDLLAGVGLKPAAAADSHEVWREHYLANNGTEEQLVLFNPTDAVKTLTIDWTTARPAGTLWDPKGRTAVAGTVSGHAVHLDKLTLQPLETRVIATQSQRPPQAAVADWFAKLALWWRPSEGGAMLPRPDLPLYTVELAATMTGRVLSGAEAAAADPAALSRTAAPGAGWKRWAGQSIAELKRQPDPARRVLLHCPVAIPATWKAGDRVELVVGTLNRGFVSGPVEVWFNGKRVVERRSVAVPGYGSLDNDGVVVDLVPLLRADGKNALCIDAGSTGFLGEVELRRRPAVSAEIAVSGVFQVQRDRDGGVGEATLPGKLEGLYAWKDGVVVPAAWKGARVFLQLEVGKLGDFDSFAINGKVVFHPVNWYRGVTWMDITPWLDFTGPNRLTLITRRGVREWKPGSLDVQAIRLQRVDAR